MALEASKILYSRFISQHLTEFIYALITTRTSTLDQISVALFYTIWSFCIITLTLILSSGFINFLSYGTFVYSGYRRTIVFANYGRVQNSHTPYFLQTKKLR